MDSFYKTNKNYQRVLAQILKSRKISKQNKATIRSFLQRLLAENISPGRIKKYLTVLRNISGIVKADFTQYTDEDMQQILAEVNGRGLAGSTVNDYKTGLKRLMRFIQGSRFNPERYRWIKLEKKHVKKFDIAYNDLLTQEEVRQLISATRNAMYRCLISLAYESGARPSELLTLTIGSLAFAEGYTRITIRESKTFIRTIYAMDSDRYLKGWLNVHPYREDKTAPLFPSSYVSRQVIGFLIPESYNTTLKRLAKKARLEKRVYSYLLRHSRVTHLLEAGWNEVMIKKLVGHSVESRAFKVYEHLAEKQVEQYILKQRNRAKEERQALGVVATIACNFCKTENEPGADFCVHCNRAISMKGLLAQEDREKLLRAKELNYPALALTDHDNLCGALAFAHTARSLDIQPIIGAEVTLSDGSHLTVLAETRQGYANLCRLLTLAYQTGDRSSPKLDPERLAEHSPGLVLLTGCRQGQLARLVTAGRFVEVESILRQYLEWFGSGNVFVELQQHLVKGDVTHNRRLTELARQVGTPVVATNNVHYHVPERRDLQDTLVAIRHRKSLEEAAHHLRPNGQFYLKSPEEMAYVFRGRPEAVSNTLVLAERCAFDLTRDLGYRFPDCPVPAGHTPQSYLEEICVRAAERRYGGVNDKVRMRLQEEFRLIRKHNLSGFFLLYHDIVQLARQVMTDLGLTDAEIPLEERPPGRGRGSSVALLVGYLIGLSHIDPLEFNLSLDRFVADDLGNVPDIDLDFPRNIREELIKRVHEKYGWERAALTGMISTYQLRGAIRDLGLALSLPAAEVDRLAQRVESHAGRDLPVEMARLPEFKDKLDAPGWRDLVRLAAELDGFPKLLAQHPGGMIISSSPLTEMVPVQPSAIEGRYVCQWDKDAVDQAGFVKIDFLALGTLSQLQECLQLIERKDHKYLDLSRIDFNDSAVYRMLHQADTIGVFQVESAAQMQTIPRIKPRNLTDMAFEVAAVRPGVGANEGVSKFIARRSHPEIPWEYDHTLERRALERTLGVILYQDQVNQLAMDLAGFSPAEADKLRRAFSKRNNERMLRLWWERFRDGAAQHGVPSEVAEKIFHKFNGHYMFPESHAFAFGVTAYHMAWLKYYYPLEFYTALFNAQPMGFYNLETIKEDARRHGIRVLNPDVNISLGKAAIHNEAVLLGLAQVREVGPAGTEAILTARTSGDPFANLRDFMERTGLKRESVEKLVEAGALDGLCPDRRRALWEVGLLYRPGGYQATLALPVTQDVPDLPPASPWETMLGEYHALGMHPSGHVMAQLRPRLPKHLSTSQDVPGLPDGFEVTVVGLVIRRQRPLAKAVFMTLEDEFGHIPLVVWPKTYERLRLVLREPLLLVSGAVSRREGTLNIVVSGARSIRSPGDLPVAKNWH